MAPKISFSILLHLTYCIAILYWKIFLKKRTKRSHISELNFYMHPLFDVIKLQNSIFMTLNSSICTLVWCPFGPFIYIFFSKKEKKRKTLYFKWWKNILYLIQLFNELLISQKCSNPDWSKPISRHLLLKCTVVKYLTI